MTTKYYNYHEIEESCKLNGICAPRCVDGIDLDAWRAERKEAEENQIALQKSVTDSTQDQSDSARNQD